MTRANAKATAIKDKDYSCHITAKIFQQIVWGLYHSTIDW